MKKLTKFIAVAIVAGTAALGASAASAWWGDDDYWGGPWGNRGYGYGGYPGYGYGGYPGYGWGGSFLISGFSTNRLIAKLSPSSISPPCSIYP